MKTNRNRNKRDKYIKYLSYALVFLFIATFRYLIDDTPSKDSKRQHYAQNFSKRAGTLAGNYYMPDNEVCRMLIAELKTGGSDFQVHHLVD